MPIEAIADHISNEKAKKELVEFGIFAMEFGKVTAGFDITRQRVIMNPRWNRAYGKGSGETNWDGALNDGKSRGNEPYFCPRGWKRFAADHISNEKAKKELVEFGIFAMEFGKVTADFNATRQKIVMNPRWNKYYGPGGTDWDGPLRDGRNRGGEPYYCPKGWKRFSFVVTNEIYQKYKVYDWPICYHGTKFDFSMMITLSGLKASGGCHGDGVYLSPSIKYVSHPR
eukprot:CAMPEP_0201594550 /NCGR_PEP_ID=MMETSP0190_2-20130828/191829_1 /ASSEMBLY_ACC=CAM_ASM_000263 /TAXON_ID=37353 /ORGANISM="Rosalina sp." /LENGTH=226 /DNA_ID=CAMNT_0048054197 /DNA_START=144 /DNA_END=821 /DNA_ORIENTATION=-